MASRARAIEVFRKATITFEKSACDPLQSPKDGRAEIAYVFTTISAHRTCLRVGLSCLRWTLVQVNNMEVRPTFMLFTFKVSNMKVRPTDKSVHLCPKNSYCLHIRSILRPCMKSHTRTHTQTWNIVMGALTTTHNRFSGRSNVGKSSLINAVCRQHGLARTSKVCAVILFFKICEQGVVIKILLLRERFSERMSD